MLGLEYICRITNKKYKDLAKELCVSTQVINNWINTRNKVPEKYILHLESIFNIPHYYFNKQITIKEELEIKELDLLNSYRKLGYDKKQCEYELSKKKEKALEEGEEEADLEYISEKISKCNTVKYNDLIEQFKTALSLTTVPKDIIEALILAIQYYDNYIYKEFNNFSRYICNAIKIQTTDLNYQKKGIVYYDVDTRDFYFNRKNKRRYYNCTEMMLSQIMPQDKEHKVYLYKTIDDIIESEENKQYHNLIMDLYGLLTIIIQDGHIQISTMTLILKAIFNVCKKYECCNPFPYKKRKHENFMNQLSRIILKYEKDDVI